MLKPEHIAKGDNLRMVRPENVASAVAALTLQKWIDAGIAVTRAERWDVEKESSDDSRSR